MHSMKSIMFVTIKEAREMDKSVIVLHRSCCREEKGEKVQLGTRSRKFSAIGYKSPF